MGAVQPGCFAGSGWCAQITGFGSLAPGGEKAMKGMGVAGEVRAWNFLKVKGDCDGTHYCIFWNSTQVEAKKTAGASALRGGPDRDVGMAAHVVRRGDLVEGGIGRGA